MAVTEYIGPIVAPHIEGEWSSAKSYESLAIVLNQGNSYISRQDVPVGVSINNEKFWVQSGNYNAQIEQYRKEVIQNGSRIADNEEAVTTETARAKQAESSLQTQITSNKEGLTKNAQALASKSRKRLAVYIGNSYTRGGGSSDDHTGMFAKTKSLFDEAYFFQADGVGFCTYVNHDVTFNTLVDRAKASTDFNNNDVTDVFFISAMGDTRALATGTSTTDFRAAVTTAVTNANAAFPNALCHVAYCETIYGRNVQSAYSNRYSAWQYVTHWNFYTLAKTASQNFAYLGWLGWNTNQLSGYNAADSYHPNDTGYNALASAFVNALEGESPYTIINKQYRTVNGSGNVIITATSPTDYMVRMSNMLPGSMPATGGKFNLVALQSSSDGARLLPNLVNSAQLIKLSDTETRAIIFRTVVDKSTGNIYIEAECNYAQLSSYTGTQFFLSQGTFSASPTAIDPS